jgi:hypothetical protein
MPARQRLRLEDNRGFAHGRAQPIEPEEDQAVCRAQPEPCWRGPLQDDKLLAQKCHLGFASRMRSEQSDEQSAEQRQEVKHPKARIAHRGICAIPDTIFGSHTYKDRYTVASTFAEVLNKRTYAEVVAVVDMHAIWYGPVRACSVVLTM